MRIVFYDYYNVKGPTASTGPNGSQPRGRTAVRGRLLEPDAKGGVGWRSTAPRLGSRPWQDNCRTGAAAMLQLDFASPPAELRLIPVLRAKMRWVVARANRCDYSQAYALADLGWRVGLDPGRIGDVMAGDPMRWPEQDREPLEFARLLTVAAPTIPDEMFERLRRRFGDKQVAAMVLLAAYGNFQDRIVLGLNLPLETSGPLAPLEIRFAEDFRLPTGGHHAPAGETGSKWIESGETPSSLAMPSGRESHTGRVAVARSNGKQGQKTPAPHSRLGRREKEPAASDGRPRADAHHLESGLFG